jgi:phosphoglycolate phosphatase
LKLTDKQAILFDLDGTLIDSVPDLALAVNEMLKALGRKTFDEATIRYWVGNGAQTLVKRALSGNREIDEEAFDDTYFNKALSLFLDAYRTHLAKITHIYPHVMETLDVLKKREYVMAIVTNKPYEFVAPILNNLGMTDYFACWLGGDSLPLKKPDPAPLLYACKKLESSVAHTVMVGDSKNDILAANACGMESVGVTYGYNYGEKIDKYGPTVVIDDFAMLLEVLA